MGIFVGIDLGTTYCAAAFVDGYGECIVIPLSDDSQTMPSNVYYAPTSTIVGQKAKDYSLLHPNNYNQQNYVSFIKRHMGEKNYRVTTAYNDSYTPQEVSAQILANIKNRIMSFTNQSIDGAVITVPAYFNDLCRASTENAATIAGIKVLEIINEPTAAAIAYHFDNPDSENQTIAVYDYGGGTFDVSILKIQSGNIQVLATCGCCTGGYDIDGLIVEYLIDRLKEKNVYVQENSPAYNNLWALAEKAKIQLSDKANISIPFSDYGLSIDLNRDDFEDMIYPLLSDTIGIFCDALQSVDLQFHDIDKLIFVGGSTKIPYLESLIKEETGSRFDIVKDIDPDKAVAIGAAFKAYSISHRQMANSQDSKRNVLNIGVAAYDEKEAQKKREFIQYIMDTFLKKDESDVIQDSQKMPHFSLQDVVSNSIGVMALDEDTRKQINCIVLEKNTPVPAVANRDFTTIMAYQPHLEITVTQTLMQGEEANDLSYATVIGNAMINLKPRNKLIPIRVTISCDCNGLIHLKAYDLDLQQDIGEVNIDRGNNILDRNEATRASMTVNKKKIVD